MDLVISGLVLLFIGGLGIFLIRKLMSSLQESFNINGHIPVPNGVGKHISLTRVNGCGMNFTGSYRRANIDQIETYVTYYTLNLILCLLSHLKPIGYVMQKMEVTTCLVRRRAHIKNDS